MKTIIKNGLYFAGIFIVILPQGCTASWRYIHMESMRPDGFEKKRHYCLIDGLGYTSPVLQVLPLDENAATYLQKKAPDDRITGLYTFSGEGSLEWRAAVPKSLGPDFYGRMKNLFERKGYSLRRHLQIHKTKRYSLRRHLQMHSWGPSLSQAVLQQELQYRKAHLKQKHHGLDELLAETTLNRCRPAPPGLDYLMTKPGPAFFGEGCHESIQELSQLAERYMLRWQLFKAVQESKMKDFWDATDLEDCHSSILITETGPRATKSTLETASIVLMVFSLGILPGYADSPSTEIRIARVPPPQQQGEPDFAVIEGKREVASVLLVPFLGTLKSKMSAAEPQRRLADAVLHALDERQP